MLVVHVAFECAPIYKTGGLGDVVGSLPKALVNEGIDTVVVMPGYNWIKRYQMLPNSRVPVIYIEGKWFHEGLKKHNPRLQAQAFAYFCKGVLEELKRRNLKPDILHCHDWHAALIPVLLKKRPDSYFEKTKTILTIHNIGYQGNFPCRFFTEGEFADVLTCFRDWKRVSFLREGMRYTDFITTVSPNHAREIKNGLVSFGLKQVLSEKRGKFMGILNGIDNSVWNPRTDDLISNNYSLGSQFSAKSENKLNLQKRLGLAVSSDIPLFAFIARLTSQKGLELLIPILTEAARQRIQIVILGSGEKKYETILQKLKTIIDPRWYGVVVKFDEKLAHLMYAGSDFFLVPSLYEPCGLTQMIAMRYGSIPVVSQVGGLVDTVTDGKTGIVFKEKTTESLRLAIERASDLWERNQDYMQMVKVAMKKDFSWGKSAREYRLLYKKVVNL
ncbi:MAG: glycogen synthase [Patescibacteria group bacterium]